MVHGYLNDDRATRAAFKDGWFYPGDLGAIMADGQLIHLGRSDQMMIMNGINIYPAEIERALGLHPAVRDVAALALRSDIHQEIPICAVTVDPTQPIAARALQQFAFDHLGSRGPKAVVILEALPRNAQGKLIRPQLAKAVLAVLKANQGPDAAHLTAGESDTAPPEKGAA
jgi:acyl-coenzyme A synthetase/AMP-(fatty) acid ligase